MWSGKSLCGRFCHEVLICLVFICGILGNALSCQAQEPGMLTPDIISSKDGLPQAFVPDILQDRQGFIWMATRDGLCRYDGSRLKIFQPKPQGKPSLSFTGVIKIILDNKGKIWILTEQGSIDVFNPHTEEFDNISRRPLFVKHLKGNFNNQMFSDSRGRIWGASFFKGITSFDTNTERVNSYPFSEAETKLFSEHPNISITELNGRIWMTTSWALSVFDEQRKKFVAYPQKLPVGPNALEFLQIRKATGELMIGTKDSFILLNPKTNKIREYLLPGKVDSGTSYLVADQSGNVYCSNNRLLFKFSEAGGLQVLADFSKEKWDCRSLFMDRSDVLWMGTNGAGVRKFNLRKGAFQIFEYKKDFAHDLISTWSKIPGNPQPSAGSRFTGYQFRYCIDKIRESTWYTYGGTEQAVYKLDHKSNTISVFRLPVRLLSQERVYPITVDPAGHVFVLQGTDILQFSDSLGQFDRVAYKLDAAILGNLFQMVSDSEHFWFISWEKGLVRYNRKTGGSRLFASQPNNPKSLSSNTLFCLSNDPLDANRLWVGTFGSGLCAFDKRTGESQRITADQGLPNNVIYSAIPDGLGNIWIGTNKGLARMNHKTLKIRTYTVDDGIMSDEFNRYHYIQFPNGYIVMGGITGFTGFDPQKLKDDNFNPLVELVSLEINNKVVSEDESRISHLPVHLLKELRLPYDQNFLTFDFAALQYNEPRRNRYRYRLDGVDEGWIESDLARAVYTDLRPGTYTLKLNASNTSGIWSPHFRLLNITIKPPVWATWWAYVIYTVTIAGIILWIFRIYVHRMKMNQLMLLKQAETEQLRAADEMKTRFFSNITHEFRTPLTLIMAPAEQLKMKLKDQEDQRKLTSINRNANQLLELINQLLDLSKLEAGALPVMEIRGELAPFVKQTFDLFEQPAQDKGIELFFENVNITGDYLFDADKIERIIHNIVYNALKFTKRDGRIALTIEQQETSVLMKISDTGIGIESQKLPSIFDRFYQADEPGTRQQQGTGIGLALVKEIIDLLKGNISVESELGKGTSFSIYLPLTRVAATTAEPVAVREEELVVEKSENQEIRILIVEDNPELSSYISTSLPTSHKISFAYDGQEGLEKALEELPDLIISDVMMPKMDGLTLCGRLKDDIRTGHIPVILLTARTTFEDRIAGLEQGADEYLAKPFKVVELQLRVRNLLESKRRQREWVHSDISSLKESIVPKPSPDPFLRELYELMDLHLDDSTFGVEQLSERMRISRIHLYRKIKSLTGFTATEFLRNYRLKQAVGFLKSGYPVSEAGYMVGFETPSYFTKCFRDLFQVTPTEFLIQKMSEN
ncbi:hybrid sensor histidine kinase/response regulator transcription factor [Dyadobacter arcticus]|uniref:histidine kinase n=1 Tax=Dyadobacter arcticus TaxID=1078754 RepID=A0ABX0UKD0_9BACT|nr:ATP-binding protein [Dyadobacter arcticus]NIJ53367.1 signal transduction histidine kinase/DNA-binding response OmpR family regulator/ligand-binding sensor domain-containing protein [Dyadobacter arcticus]